MRHLIFSTVAAAIAAQTALKVETIFVSDCTGVARVLPGTPLETNVDLRFFKKALDRAAAEITAIAAKNNASCDGQLTEEIIRRQFVPSVEAMLNYLSPNRRRLPAACPSTTFPQTWYDSSFIEGLVFADSTGNLFVNGIGARQNWSIPLPATCTYDSWLRGEGCRLKYTEPTTGTQLQLAVDKCGSSVMPYVSLSIQGDFLQKMGRPCLNVGSAVDCGSGLVCSRIGQPWSNFVAGRSMQDLIQNVLSLAGLMDQPTDLDACAVSGRSGLTELTRKIRDKVFSLFNMPAPTDLSNTDFGFCMPASNAWSGWSNSFVNPGQSNVAIVQTPSTDPATVACAATGCPISKVGNGICEMRCNTPACKYDGGDCLKTRSTHYPSGCYASGGADTNTVEACNGYAPDRYSYYNDVSLVYNYYSYYDRMNYVYSNGQYGYCSTWYMTPQCSCNCVLKPGAQSTGTRCENCQAPILCPGSYNQTTGAVMSGGSCQAMNTVITGFGNLVSAWDGMLSGGAMAGSPDRKSGAMFTKVATRFDVGASLGPNFAPLIQTTCTGDIAISLGNPNVGITISMPRLPELASFVSQTLQEAVQCRLKTIDASSMLSQAQFYARYGLHQLAAWAYQFTGFGSSSADVPQLRSFGSRAISDFLLRREPFSIADTQWTAGWRMAAPSSTECSLSSLLEPGNRRCRFTYNNLANLFTNNGITPKLTFHVDIEEDVCTGAPMGNGQTMTATDAAHTFPLLNLWVESDFVRAVNALKPCSGDGDCAALPGTSCFDLDVGISTGMDFNPLARFVYGNRYLGKLGASSTDFLGVLRRGAMSMGAGAATVAAGLDTSNELKFCIPRVQAVIDNFQSWSTTAYNQGSCDGSNTHCISNPARLTGMGDPTVSGLYSGVANVATAASTPAPPPQTAVSFKVKLPGITRATFTNAVRARLQQVISEQLAARGIIVPPQAIVFTGIAEVTTTGTGGRVLQTGGATAAVAVTFSIDVTQTTLAPTAAAPASSPASSTDTVTAALTTQLTTTTSPVTLASSMGSLLASEGIIQASGASAAVAVSTSTTLPGEQATYTSNGVADNGGSSGGASGGAIAGIVIGVLILLGVVGGVAAFFILRKPQTKPLQAAAGTPRMSTMKPMVAGPGVVTVSGAASSVVIITQTAAPQPMLAARPEADPQNPDFAVTNPVGILAPQKASFEPQVLSAASV